jgi:hypothetical protein
MVKAVTNPMTHPNTPDPTTSTTIRLKKNIFYMIINSNFLKILHASYKYIYVIYFLDNPIALRIPNSH